MNEFTELCYGVLFSPKRTFGELRDNPPVQAALLIVVLVNALQAMLNGIIGSANELVKGGQLGANVPAQLESLLKLYNSPGFLPIIAGAGVILAVGWLFVKSALLSLVAELLGGTGTARGVLTVMGAAQLPMILVIPVYLLAYLLELPPALGAAATFLFWIYTAFVLPAQGIAQVHNFSVSRAVATVLSPIIVLVTASFLFSLLLVGGAAILGTML